MHTTPYYARAPLGQTLPASSTAITVAPSPMASAWRVVSLLAGGALAYHGYRRTGSVGWALVWAIAGGIVWPAGIGIAMAQGFGRPAMQRNRRRR